MKIAHLRGAHGLLSFILVLFLLAIILAATNDSIAGNNNIAQSPRWDTPVVATKQAPSLAESASGRMLVKFKKGVAPSQVAAAHLDLNSTTLKKFSIVNNLELVTLASPQSVEAALETFRKHSSVAYAEPDYILKANVVPNDTYFTYLWALENTGQFGGLPGADIKAPEAWDITTGSRDVVVAVIDTGVDYMHLDLSPNIWRNPWDCDGDGIDDDSNGYADDCHGINVVDDTGDPWDDNMHGTHVAGIIGAQGNNNLGVVGVNWNVSIMACRFLGSGGDGYTSGAITCLEYVKAMKDKGINVIATNNSYGGFGYSQAFEEAIQAHENGGILFIVAAGNDSESNDIYPVFPATFNRPNVIAVAATGRTDELAIYSNEGKQTVHIGAPGDEILSTTTGGAYNIFGGTSMATPYVTGVAALLKAQDPSRDWRTIKNLILSGGDTTPGLLGSTITGKRLSAIGSLACLNNVVLSRMRPIGRAIMGYVGVPLDLSVLHVACGVPNGAVTVTVDPGRTAITLRDDGVGSDQVGGDGIYSGSWTPSSTGNYTITFSGGDTVVLKIVGGANTVFREVTRADLVDHGLSNVVIGDVNGDGKQDVIATSIDHEYPEGPRMLHAFLQNPSGDLSAPISYLIGPYVPAGYVHGLDTGDLNNDGRTDVAIAAWQPYYVDENFVGIFLQNASGGLNPMVRYSTYNTYRLKAGDVNSDGLTDIITVGFHHNVIYVDILYQNPHGGFDPAETHEIVFDMVHDVFIEIADVNGDGRKDIVVVSVLGGTWTDFPHIAILYQQQDGTVSQPYFLDTGLRASLGNTTSGDLNGDGHADIAFVSGGNRYSVPKPMAELLIQDNSGQLEPSGGYPVTDGPMIIKIVDLDGDGRADILVNHQYSVSILFQAPNGAFLPYVTQAVGPGNAVGMAVGDVNGDGRPDAVLVEGSRLTVLYNEAGQSPDKRSLWILMEGNGRGTVVSKPAGIDCGIHCQTEFDFGTYVMLTAESSPGSFFGGWRGEECFFTPEGACTIPLRLNAVVQANFYLEKVHLDIQKTGAGGGTVTSHPHGINCGTDCTEDYRSYTQVTLTATPDPNSVFERWEDYECSPYLTCILTMGGNYIAKPRFRLKDVPLTVTKTGTGDGTIVSSPEGVNCGTTCTHAFAVGTLVTLTATAVNGSVFGGWGGACTGKGACVVTMDSAKDVSATFVSPLIFTTSYLPYGEVGVPYEVVLEVHGGTPPYIAMIAQGAMPEGLHLIAGPAIYGTPTKVQSASFTLSVTDSAGTSVEGKFKTKIYKSLAITTKELPTEKVGQTYKARLKAKGGKQPYSWSLQGGSLPDGLTLDTITGIIAGIPRETGTFITTFEVNDVLGGKTRKTFTWSVTP